MSEKTEIIESISKISAILTKDISQFQESQEQIQTEKKEHLQSGMDMETEEYLVSGAKLRCRRARKGTKILVDDEEIALRAETDGEEPTVTLKVSEKKHIAVRDLYFATVSDAVRDENIEPFRCVCSSKYSESDKEILRDHIEDCKTGGTCQHLMDLNKKWENTPLKDGRHYFQFY